MREKTIVQTCIDLLRNFFNYASKRNCAQLAEDLKLLYRAQSEFGALDRSAEFSGNRESANAAWYYPHPSLWRRTGSAAGSPSGLGPGHGSKDTHGLPRPVQLTWCLSRQLFELFENLP